MHTPRLQGRLRDMARAIAGDPGPIVARIGRTLIDHDASYAALSPAVKQDVREFLAFSAGVWFRTILEGDSPTETELQVLSDTARRRVHQGISLTSLLRAVRLGSRELWSTLLEVARDDAGARDELVVVFSSHLLDYFDDLAERIASAYLDEQFQHARWRDALRYELTSVIFSFPDDESAFRRAATALGLDPSAPRVCLALDVILPESLPSHREGELDRTLLAIARSIGVPADDLVRSLYRERMVIWLPVARGDSVLAADHLVQGMAAELRNAVSCVRKVGIGLMNQGARGWATSMEEAFRALDQGPRLAPLRTVFPFSAMVLNESVLRSDNALRYLDAMMERLTHDTELLTTLAVFFDGGQHRKQASEQLGIHPNTLNYRLGRIEEILGGTFDDAAWLSRLHVALTLRRASERDPPV
jgi:sugar diacid utilization regulator